MLPLSSKQKCRDWPFWRNGLISRVLMALARCIVGPYVDTPGRSLGPRFALALALVSFSDRWRSQVLGTGRWNMPRPVACLRFQSHRVYESRTTLANSGLLGWSASAVLEPKGSAGVALISASLLLCVCLDLDGALDESDPWTARINAFAVAFLLVVSWRPPC